jgi:hypothetical protein
MNDQIKKLGRPKSDKTLSNAEKQRAYRVRKAAKQVQMPINPDLFVPRRLYDELLASNELMRQKIDEMISIYTRGLNAPGDDDRINNRAGLNALTHLKLKLGLLK